MAAGKSPNALQNIAEGGIKGLQAYNESKDKFLASQEKLDAAEFAMADARNRFNQEGSKAALEDYQSSKKDRNAAKRDFIKLQKDYEVKRADIAKDIRGQDLTYKAAMDSHSTMLKQAEIYSQGGVKNTDRILDNLKDLNDPKRYENAMRDAALANPGNNPVLAKKIADAKQVLADRDQLININKSLLAGAGVNVGGGARQMSALDQQALAWANSNPNDPRAKQIKARLGV